MLIFLCFLHWCFASFCFFLLNSFSWSTESSSISFAALCFLFLVLPFRSSPSNSTIDRVEWSYVSICTKESSNVGLGSKLRTVKKLLKGFTVYKSTHETDFNDETYLRQIMDGEVARKEHQSPSISPWRWLGTLDIHTWGSRKASRFVQAVMDCEPIRKPFSANFQ